MRRKFMSDIGDPRVLRDYELISELGCGSFAVVYRARHKVTGEYVAVKLLSKVAILQNDLMDPVARELEIMKIADHPFVVHLFEILEDDNYIFLVMELLEGGNLLDYINDQGALPEDNARRIFTQLVSAIEYLHDTLKVVHRDLKAENILFDKNYNLRIIDFGLSRRESNECDVFSTVCGSPAYAAPEVILGNRYSHGVDIWSMGIILYGMCVGSLPFYDPNISRQLQLVLSQVVFYPPNLSPMLCALLERLLERDPARRITLEQIKQHPWVTGGGSYVGAMDTTAIAELCVNSFPVSPMVNGQMRALKLSTATVQAGLSRDCMSKEAVAYRILRTKEITDLMVLTGQQELQQPIVGSLPHLMPLGFAARDVGASPISVTKYTSNPERCCLSPLTNTKPVRRKRSTHLNIDQVPGLTGAPLNGLGSPLGHVKRARALSLAPVNLVKPALRHSALL